MTAASLSRPLFPLAHACKRQASMMLHASSKCSGMCNSYEWPLPCTSTTCGVSASCRNTHATNGYGKRDGFATEVRGDHQKRGAITRNAIGSRVSGRAWTVPRGADLGLEESDDIGDVEYPLLVEGKHLQGARRGGGCGGGGGVRVGAHVRARGVRAP